MQVGQLQKFDDGIEQRVKDLRRAHTELYGETGNVMVAYAPGRAEILGNHTDYNEGFTLSANVSKNLLIAASPRNDKKVRIQSQYIGGEPVEFDISDADALWQQRSEHGAPHAWSNYVKGVLWAYMQAGHAVQGFDGVIESTIPPGGVSSSAALETAVSRLICDFNMLNVSEFEQVQLCKLAENEYAGAPCGYLDQATVGLSHDWLFMSYRPEGEKPFTYEPVAVDMSTSGYLLVVGYDPESKHALVDGKYALRQGTCHGSLPALAEQLGREVTSLRDVSTSELEAHRPDLLATLGQQAMNFVTHVVYENQRVLDGRVALLAGDYGTFGKLMTESGQSALDLYELDEDSPELRFVLDYIWGARDQLGVIGARNMGGGFNATTLSLVAASQADSYMEQTNREYHERFGRPYQFLSFVPSPAAAILELSKTA